MQTMPNDKSKLMDQSQALIPTIENNES